MNHVSRVAVVGPPEHTYLSLLPLLYVKNGLHH